MIFVRRAILTAGFIGALSSTAAAWTINVDGPDVFGKMKALAAEGSDTEGLVVQCDSKDELDLAYIFKADKPDEISEAEANLYIQTNGNAPVKLQATIRGWNSAYGGVVAAGRTAEIVHEIEAIRDAKGPIQIGAEVDGNQVSASVTSNGSTAVMQRLIDACKLSDIVSEGK